MIIPVQSATAGVYVADLEWNGGAPINNKTFKLYSFVDSVTGTEYLVDDKDTEDTSDDTVDLSAISADATLYAKYNTGIIVGDIDLSGEIKAADANGLRGYSYNNNSSSRYKLIGEKIYAGSDIIIGDIDISGEIKALDANGLRGYSYNNNSSSRYKKIGQTIYLLNKQKVDEGTSAVVTDVEVIYVTEVTE